MTKQEYAMLTAAVNCMSITLINDKPFIMQQNVLFLLQETYNSSKEKEIDDGNK